MIHLLYLHIVGISFLLLMVALSAAATCSETSFPDLGRDGIGGTVKVVHSQDTCRAFLDITLDYGVKNDFSEMEFSLLPNGIEAIFPDGSSGPIVSIYTEDSNIPINYKSTGFRLIVPGEHSLLTDKPFAAELQFFHKIHETSDVMNVPSFLGIGIGIDVDEQTGGDSMERTIATIIQHWQQIVESLEVSCNVLEEISADTVVVEETVPVVVGRGDEHNFANDPIRRLENKTVLFESYDSIILSSSVYYSFEEDVSCDWKEDTILWNIADTTWNVPEEAMSMITNLLERNIDPLNCQPLSNITITSVVADSAAVTKSTTVDATKLCRKSPDHRSKSSQSLTVWWPMAILTPLGALAIF